MQYLDQNKISLYERSFVYMFFFSDVWLDREEILSLPGREYRSLPSTLSDSHLDPDKSKAYYSFFFYPFYKISIFSRKCDKIPGSFFSLVSPEYRWKGDSSRHIISWVPRVSLLYSHFSRSYFYRWAFRWMYSYHFYYSVHGGDSIWVHPRYR